MTATMTTAAEVVTPFSELTDDQVDLGRAELFRHVGAEASDTGWMRRLGRRGDGEWMLLVRVTTPGVPGFERNLFSPYGPQISAAYHRLVEGVRLVRAGVEAEADRITKGRADHLAENARLIAEEKERVLRKEESARRLEADWKEKRERFRFDRWSATASWAQAFLWEALIWEPTHPEQARKLRELAQPAIGQVGKRGEVGVLPFPGQPWEP